MSIAIRQTSKQINEDRWDWEIHLDGEQKDLSEIDYVEYTLHQSFPNPIRRVYNHHSGFKLETNGWGTFPVYLTVKYKNKKEIRDTLELDFAKDIKKELPA
jgi:transcription initiation factor IIF auxiliary subunit